MRWIDPCALLNANADAQNTFVPFLKIRSGSVVAFWDDDGDERIVLCTSEGRQKVLAASFSDFLVKLGDARTPWLEEVDLDGPLDTNHPRGMALAPEVSESIQR